MRDRSPLKFNGHSIEGYEIIFRARLPGSLTLRGEMDFVGSECDLVMTMFITAEQVMAESPSLGDPTLEVKVREDR